MKTIPGRWTVLFLVVATCVRMVATPVASGGASLDAGRISFYGDIGNIISSQNPLLVRPSTLLLAEDGSVALAHLRWRDWGASIARATGVWTASNCAPSCATGTLATSPARLTLSDPGLVLGRRVYRCFQIYPPHPRRDIADQGCIRRLGAFYHYVPGPPR